MYNIGGKAYMFLAEQSKDVNINEIDTYMYDNSKIYGRLKVSENTNASVEGLAYATIADSEKENNKNIPFLEIVYANQIQMKKRIIFRKIMKQLKTKKVQKVIANI